MTKVPKFQPSGVSVSSNQLAIFTTPIYGQVVTHNASLHPSMASLFDMTQRFNIIPQYARQKRSCRTNKDRPATITLNKPNCQTAPSGTIRRQGQCLESTSPCSEGWESDNGTAGLSNQIVKTVDRNIHSQQSGIASTSEVVRPGTEIASPELVVSRTILLTRSTLITQNGTSKESEAYHAKVAHVVAGYLHTRPNFEKHLVEAVWMHVDRMIGRISKKEIEDLYTPKKIHARLETSRMVVYGILSMSDPDRLRRSVWRTKFTLYELSEMMAVVTLRYLGGHTERTRFTVTCQSQEVDVGGFLDWVEKKILPTLSNA